MVKNISALGLFWTIILPSFVFAAKEQIETSQNFSLVWQAPWSIPKLALFGIFCFLAYTILTTNFFAWLLDKRKPADSCMMPQRAFKLTLILIVAMWTILFGCIFGLTPNQELRITSNVIPGGKSLFIVNYLDTYLCFFIITCLFLIALLYIIMPAGEQRSSQS